MNKVLQAKYEELGLSPEVIAFGAKIEEQLKERFMAIDEIAEANQLKVLHALQKNRVSAECFNQSSGYGYNDMGRDTLERVYADTFKGEDALVRPQITCGTHALALALMSNLRPGDELLSPVGKPYDTLSASSQGGEYLLQQGLHPALCFSDFVVGSEYVLNDCFVPALWFLHLFLLLFIPP